MEENTRKKRTVGRPCEDFKKVRIIETGEVFDSYREAANAIRGNRSCVYLALKGWRKGHKGYTFEYVDDDIL